MRVYIHESRFIEIKLAVSLLCWRRQSHPTPALLPGKSHGWRSLEDCSPWGCWGSDRTEWLHFHFSLSCIGEGNGNPLQCSCLENPRDGGAWWAAIYGVTQSRIRLKWLSSYSSGRTYCLLSILHMVSHSYIWIYLYWLYFNILSMCWTMVQKIHPCLLKSIWFELMDHSWLLQCLRSWFLCQAIF